MMLQKVLRRSKQIALITLAAIGLSILPASAWNSVGHRTVAELAWRQLSASEKKAVSELLRQHPHYKSILTSDVPKGVDKDEWAFLTAAVWPDWVRPAKRGQPHKPESVTKYDVYPHAIGYPFLRAGETNKALLDNFYIAQPNAEVALSNSVALLHDRKASAQDRAVALCWVLHLTGDLHQPLHAANMVTSERPRGEGLGGAHIVINPRQLASDKKMNLHTYWDQLPGTDTSYKAIAKLADELSAAPDLKVASLKEYSEAKTIPGWVQESFRAAVDFAYSDQHVKYVLEPDLKSGKATTSDIPTLSPEYISGSHEIGRRRIVLAGQRLADELKAVW